MELLSFVGRVERFLVIWKSEAIGGCGGFAGVRFVIWKSEPILWFAKALQAPELFGFLLNRAIQHLFIKRQSVRDEGIGMAAGSFVPDVHDRYRWHSGLPHFVICRRLLSSRRDTFARGKHASGWEKLYVAENRMAIFWKPWWSQKGCVGCSMVAIRRSRGRSWIRYCGGDVRKEQTRLRCQAHSPLNFAGQREFPEQPIGIQIVLPRFIDDPNEIVRFSFRIIDYLVQFSDLKWRSEAVISYTYNKVLRFRCTRWHN
jgi:hypothetical protein